MYLPIEDYGLIGNMRTAALVGKNGSVDWYCFPRFDSPSVFAAILDDKKGGRFLIQPQSDVISHKQLYWPETNVLITRFHCSQGIAEIIDFMPVRTGDDSDVPDRIIRKVSLVTGNITIKVRCEPAFNYGRDSHSTEITATGACFHSDKLSLGLSTEVPLKQADGAVTGSVDLAEGQSAVFVLQGIEHDAGCGLPVSEEQAQQYFRETVGYWRRWLSQCTYTGRWREMVRRSALVLKLLTYEPTGAIVAAPTCSLPETLGGQRNWDYRFTWIRDAAFTLCALMRIGFDEEAAKFTQWLQQRVIIPLACNN